MTSQIIKDHAELKKNFNKLSDIKQDLLRKNAKQIQTLPIFPKNFPNIIKQAMQETEDFQNIPNLTQSTFLEKFSERYNDPHIEGNFGNYLSNTNRPNPLRMRNLLDYFSELTSYPLSLYLSHDEIELNNSAYEKFSAKLNEIHPQKTYASSEEIAYFINKAQNATRLTHDEKRAQEKKRQRSLWEVNNPKHSYYPYSDTVFKNSISLFEYLNQIILEAIESMLLLFQRMYWLNWHNPTTDTFDSIKTNYFSKVSRTNNFLNASDFTNEVVRTKAAFVSNITMIEYSFGNKWLFGNLIVISRTNENKVAKISPNYNFNYRDLLDNPIFAYGKIEYTSQELQKIFDEYFPNVKELIQKWKTEYPEEFLGLVSRNLDYNFQETCREFERSNKQVNEKELVFFTVANSFFDFLMLKDSQYSSLWPIYSIRHDGSLDKQTDFHF